LTQFIRHDIKETLESIEHLNSKDFTDLFGKGLMTERCFKSLVSAQKNDQLSEKEIWDFLVQLELATELKDPHSLYIPSLASSDNEVAIKLELEKFKKSWDSVGFHYSFQKYKKTSHLFNSVLSKLANKKDYFYKTKNPGISFSKSYASKIEERSLGLVAGLSGSFKWSDSPLASIQQTVDFLVLEYDHDNTREEYNFARHKGITVFLKPQNIDPAAFPFHAIRIFDNIIKEILQASNDTTEDVGDSFERLLICTKCSMDGRPRDSYFRDMGDGFHPLDEMEKCSGITRNAFIGHNMSENQKTLIQNEVNHIGDFFKDGIQKIPKRPFGEVIKELVPGDQVWLYRDEEENLISRIMPYAHVLVYVGYGNVVHVTKHWHGLMTGTFELVPIKDIMKKEKKREKQPVFLGHEIPEFKHAFNFRDTIANRALACAKPPQLVFDYDHKSNCEAFANILTEAADFQADILGVQEENAPNFIVGIFHIIRGLKFFSGEKCLTRVVEERLKKKTVTA